MTASTGYLDIEDIIPSNFARKPRAVVVEAGNGMGKTHAAARYAVYVQKAGFFERIYILEPSHGTAENIARKIEAMGGKVLYYKGIERHCPYRGRIAAFVKSGLPTSLVCASCPLFQGKTRRAYTLVRDKLTDQSVRRVEPEIVRGLTDKDTLCTHPIVKSIVLDPTLDFERREQLNTPLIIVAPYQAILSHAVLHRWRKYGERQRTTRRILFIIDEGDSLLYNGLPLLIPELNPTQDDYNLLALHSPKRRRLELLLDIYQEVYKLVASIYRKYGRPDADDLRRFKLLLDEAEPLLRSFERRRKKILADVLQSGMRTVVFIVASILESMLAIEHPLYVLRTVEEVPNLGYLLVDYDIVVRFLLDTAFPFSHIWKIVLSATFPTEEILRSDLLSPRSAMVLGNVEKRTKSYRNVYMTSCSVFGDSIAAVNRNEELPGRVQEVLRCVVRAFKTYSKRFKTRPRGALVWLGNKQQLKTVVDEMRSMGATIYYNKYRMPSFSAGGLEISFNYVGSAVARGVDMRDYDISFVVAPLLRPPRFGSYLDPIDFSKAVAETVQSAMRIVRSPVPKKPKLIMLEERLTSTFYAKFYPEWLKELARTAWVELEA